MLNVRIENSNLIKLNSLVPGMIVTDRLGWYWLIIDQKNLDTGFYDAIVLYDDEGKSTYQVDHFSSQAVLTYVGHLKFD